MFGGFEMRALSLLFACLLIMAWSPSLAQSGNIYGAIAYSPGTGAYGYSHNYRSRGQAEQAALGNCVRHARDCRVVVWFYNACGALASGRRNGWGHGFASTRQQAANIAMNYCRQNDQGCQLRQTVCSFG